MKFRLTLPVQHVQVVEDALRHELHGRYDNARGRRSRSTHPPRFREYMRSLWFPVHFCSLRLCAVCRGGWETFPSHNGRKLTEKHIAIRGAGNTFDVPGVILYQLCVQNKRTTHLQNFTFSKCGSAKSLTIQNVLCWALFAAGLAVCYFGCTSEQIFPASLEARTDEKGRALCLIQFVAQW